MNIGEGGCKFIESSILVSVILAFSHKKKMPLNKYYINILSLCCLYIECEIIAMQKYI